MTDLWIPGFCLYHPSRGLDPQCDLQVLVNDITDADRWDDFHEVGGEASVQTRGSFGPNDVPEESRHAHLWSAFQRR